MKWCVFMAFTFLCVKWFGRFNTFILVIDCHQITNKIHCHAIEHNDNSQTRVFVLITFDSVDESPYLICICLFHIFPFQFLSTKHRYIQLSGQLVTYFGKYMFYTYFVVVAKSNPRKTSLILTLSCAVHIFFFIFRLMQESHLNTHWLCCEITKWSEWRIDTYIYSVIAKKNRKQHNNKTDRRFPLCCIKVNEQNKKRKKNEEYKKIIAC